MKPYRIIPNDVLFFRDARPMTAGEGSGGHGGRWPEPSAIFDALHRALHETFPEKTNWDWEKPHKNREARNNMPRQRFGSLSTAGLFPIRNNQWFFPCPADVTRAKADTAAETLALLEAQKKTSNLPSFLRYLAASNTPPSKEIPPAWWSKAAWDAYLADTALPKTKDCLFKLSEFAAAEWHTGIGIDDETGTQDGERIYSAEYLRLRPEIALGFAASIQGENGTDVLDALRQAAPGITVGGQQRVSRMECLGDTSLGSLLPFAKPPTTERIKWVLLTPAIFPTIGEHPGGWLPNWIDATNGKVLLQTRTDLTRHYEWRGGKRRAVRSDKDTQPIQATLVAARIPKPVVLTGYSQRQHLPMRDDGKLKKLDAGPRETLLAVPAGSVYYFEAEANTALGTTAAQEAHKLADALNWHGAVADAEAAKTIQHRRSTLWGEKGYGLGVCGTWKSF